MRSRRSHDGEGGKAAVMFFGTTQEPKIHLLSSLLTGPRRERCRTRVFPPEGRLETSQGEDCKPLSLLRCSRST